MRIGLTVDSLSPTLTGIGRYTWELCVALARHVAVEDLALFRFDTWIEDPAAYLRPRRRTLPRPRWLKSLMMRPGFRGRLIHGTNYFLPRRTEVGVLTVHDLSVFVHPETHPPERIRAFERGFVSSLDLAAHIITDSEAVRQELLAYSGLPSDRVTKVFLGVSAAFRQVGRAEREPVLRRLLGKGFGEYMLSVATFEPRKRIEQAILAHAALSERRRIPPLVLVGAPGWRNEALHVLIARQQARGAIIMLGHVADLDLPSLYAGARLFLYPSIYEGFGLPPIEAMASGVPVIVSNQSCLPEVTQGAAMMLDPDDIEGFAEGVRRGLEDDNWRGEAISRGLDVAAGYTWEKCVESTVEVYRRVWRQCA